MNILVEGEREDRVNALEALSGNPDATVMGATVALLDDPDVIARWKAAKNLLLLSPSVYSERLLGRLEYASKEGLWMRLEILWRSGVDFEPSRLSFLIDRLEELPAQAKFDERKARRGSNRRIRLVAMKALSRCSATKEATRLMIEIAKPDVDYWQTGQTLGELAKDREGLIRWLESAPRNEPRLDYVIGKLGPDIRALPLYLRYADYSKVAEVLAKTDSQELIEGGLNYGEDTTSEPHLRRSVLEALVRNRRIPWTRFEPRLAEDDRLLATQILKALTVRLVQDDPAAVVPMLNRVEDQEAVRRFVDSLFRGFGFYLDAWPRVDERRSGVFLDARDPGVRQIAAVGTLLWKNEPYMKKAAEILEQAEPVALDRYRLRSLYWLQPESGRPLAWRALRQADLPEETARTLARLVMSEGRRELVDLLERRKAAGDRYVWEVLLEARARTAVPDDALRFRAILAGERSSLGFHYAGLGLVNLSDETGLVPFLSTLDEVRFEGWIPGYAEDMRAPEAVSAECNRRILSFLQESFPVETISRALGPAWEEGPSPRLVTLMGSVKTKESRTLLVEALKSKTRLAIEAARSLSDLSDPAGRAALHQALAHSDGRVRRAALESLVLGEDPDRLTHLVAALSDPDVAKYAHDVLLVLDPKIVVPAVSARVNSDKNWELSLVAHILARIAPEHDSLVQAIGRLLNAEPWHVRNDPMLVDRVRGDPRLRPFMKQALRSSQSNVRSFGIECLAVSGEAGVGALLAQMLEDKDAESRKSALQGLLYLESKAGLQNAMALADRGDWTHPLLDYLASFDHPRRTEILEKVAFSGKHSMTAAALYHLAQLKSGRAIEIILENWSRKPDEFYLTFRTYFDGRSLLREITGNTSLEAIEEWEEWLAEQWPRFSFPPGRVKATIDSYYDLPGKKSKPTTLFPGAKPKPLNRLREWRGQTFEEFEGKPYFAIQDAVTWKALWKRLRLPAPAMDFTLHHAIIGHYSDPQPSNGASFSTDFAGWESRDGETVIYAVRTQASGATMIVHHAGTLWHVAVVPKLTLPIRFEIAERVQ